MGSVVLDSAAAGDPVGDIGAGAGACGGPLELTHNDHVETHGFVDGEDGLGRIDHLGENQAPVGYEHLWGRVALPDDPLVEERGKQPRCC